MKILLDECIDRRLAKELKSHSVVTVPQRGWATIKNGALMALAQNEFDAFVTVDRNLRFQQNVSKYKIAVVVVHCKSNRLSDLQPFVPEILAALPKCKAGVVIHVGEESR